MNRCDNCGSANHQVYDCSKPYNGWREREPQVIPPIESVKPVEAKPSSSVKVVKKVKEPFLTESTRRSIDQWIGEQKRRMDLYLKTGKIESSDTRDMAVAVVAEDRKPLNLPKAEKKPKQSELKVEGGLF